MGHTKSNCATLKINERNLAVVSGFFPFTFCKFKYMKKRLLDTMLFLLLLFGKTLFAQPVINERFFIDESTYSIFSSVFVTDSCYFVGSVHSSETGLSTIESSFTQFNFDGTIEDNTIIENDTLGIGFWYTTELIRTLDNNFATMTLSHSATGTQTIAFIKMNSSGDTLSTSYFPEC